MWRSRRKPSRENSNNNRQICRTPSNPNFNIRSFKDVVNLFSDDDKSIAGAGNFPDLNKTLTSKRFSIFHRVYLANQFARAFSTGHKPDPVKPPPESHNVAAAAAAAARPEKSEPSITIPGAEKRVVIYMTSLRVVRQTFDACRTVDSILRGFRVSIDERDLSMDSMFVDELRRIMAQVGGGEYEKTKLSLPRVFVGGRYVGGAEEVRQLHETGELKKLVEGLPLAAPGVCEICGGFRFILCDECSGSHKCYTDKCGFRSCTLCNENGLVRCPSCLSP